MTNPLNRFDRRNFLGLAGGAAVAGLVGGMAFPRRADGAQNSVVPAAQDVRTFGDPASRTLIVVDMEGGNDALNTFVPATGRYHDLRPTLGLPDDEQIGRAHV